MLKSYLLIAFRNLRKHKVPTAINVGGLSVGIACCLLLFLYVEQEWRYDRFHEASDRLFRVTYSYAEPDGDVNTRAKSPPLLAPELKELFPEVENTVRVARQTLRVSTDRLTDEEQSVEFADSSLFEMFSFDLQQGDARTALATPSQVILSNAAAQKYFGDEDPMGQRLTIELKTGKEDFIVAGLLRDVPEYSSLQFHVLLPYEQYPNTFSEWFRKATFSSWEIPLPTVETYVLLSDETAAPGLAAKLPAFVEGKYEDNAEGRGFALQPLTAVHLSPKFSGGLEPTSDPLYSYLLAGIALLVLAIACINFVTLMLGRSVDRAREVGVRKVVGAGRRQIRRQFWGEALLTTALALLAGLALTELFLPTFNTLAGKTLTLDLLERPVVWLAAAVLVLVTGLLAGAYPAIILSRFHPAAVLKGRAAVGGGRGFTRVLVTVQFALSIALLCGTFAMSRQLDFMIEKDLGFNPARLVVLNLSGTDDSKGIYEILKQEADRHPAIEEVTGAFFSFGMAGLDVELQEGEGPMVTAHMNPVDTNFMEVMDITLLQGRGLAEIGSAREVLVNEAFVHTLGWEDPIGRVLPVAEEATFASTVEGMTIAGIVEDFHLESLHTSIKPVILAPRATMGGNVMTIAARVQAGRETEALGRLEALWRQTAPEKPFHFEFLEDVVAGQYETERQWRSIMGYASGFALLIACFGLFGLAALTASRRTKEIGIRKVLGASIGGLVLLLSRDFVKLVAMATVVAAPLAYFALDRWLATFAYHIELSGWIFLLAGLAALGIAFVTVSYQAIKAALADPVKSLRYE